MDIAATKRQHDCRSWVASELGQPRQTTNTWSKWLCPFHEEKDPSFTVWADGFKCFGCGKHGDLIDWLEMHRGLKTHDAIELLKQGQPDVPQRLIAKAHRQQSIAVDEETRGKRLIASAHRRKAYAQALIDDAHAIAYLEGRGVPQAVAMHFGLGYRANSPWGPCISIPWMVNGELRGIQYRMIDNDTMRYRWDNQIDGKPTIYNANVVAAGTKPLWIVEGAFKALVLITHGLESVALVNKQGWKAGWAQHFRHRPVFVCLDPDAEQEAEEVAADIGPTSKVVHLPRKPDDLIVEYGWTSQAMERFARVGRLQ